MYRRRFCPASLLHAAALAIWAFAALTPSFLSAQPARPGRAAQVVSPAVAADRQVTFRIVAPKAESVRLGGSDIPGAQQLSEMTKDENGVWSITVGPLAPGAYRYNFTVDGLSVIDPRNPATSESHNNTWSLVVVEGAPFQDTRDVPRGAVSVVTYYSKSLEQFRRMHIYTPPGYEAGEGTYPVFYLLHGASDCDHSWSSVGRAGFILDNLIADGKAKAMVVVMPAGHIRRFDGFPAGLGSTADEFLTDFVEDIMSYVESRYRVKAERASRAIAGLSMGGAQTLNIAFAHLDKFAHIGVYSSGVFSLGRRAGPQAPAGPSWEEQHQATLEDADLKEGLKLVWFATGENDFLVETTRATVEMLKKHEFDVVYHETDGSHTWDKWRDYLRDFTPLLFQE